MFFREPVYSTVILLLHGVPHDRLPVLDLLRDLDCGDGGQAGGGLGHEQLQAHLLQACERRDQIEVPKKLLQQEQTRPLSTSKKEK